MLLLEKNPNDSEAGPRTIGRRGFDLPPTLRLSLFMSVRCQVEERKLIWLRAARVPWKAITWEFGCDRTTAWRRWTLALTKIAARLNAH